ncbi:MAG: hypothetical protein JWM16_6225, partial [Verrucomicrobiales bacterium]|nr:hypothetical protein [Verrucomicrobiales bacterium]
LYFGSTLVSSAGGSDIFVAKYSTNGVHQWSKRFGSPKGNAAVDESGCGIAVDTNSNTLLITGNFDETVDFGGGPLTSTSGEDMFLAKLSFNGTYIWSKRMGGTGGTIGTGVAIDRNSNILVTGNFSSVVDFGSGAVTAFGSVDVFLAKYTSSGGNLWMKHFGTNSPWQTTSTATAIALDSLDNAIITGSYQMEMSFGGINLLSNGYGDIFVAKYSGLNGSHIWSQGFGGVGVDQCNSVAVGRNDDIYITGKLGSSFSFGGDLLPFTSGQMNIFVTSLKSDGSYRWAKSYGVGLGESKGLTIDILGNIDVTGNYSSASFSAAAPLPNSGLRDIFVLKFAP